jgi:hypothetical protein
LQRRKRSGGRGELLQGATLALFSIFLLGVSFQIHNFWKVDDAQMKQIDMINFTKNMALIGALLMFLLLPHPWPMSLGSG